MNRREFIFNAVTGLFVASTPKIFIDLGANLAKLQREKELEEASKKVLEGIQHILKEVDERILYDVSLIPPINYFMRIDDYEDKNGVFRTTVTPINGMPTIRPDKGDRIIINKVELALSGPEQSGSSPKCFIR